ncbi:anoctamin-1 isoform X2 [Episyrphus balteatus]|uniref:anoctamin-1 isoform X2 n=1 Tax=Episyrphus balteatus TaxID=286459 RepID=UPI002485AC8B|nr:anoctamin-1 isoform X2 [Episyrphus balteatus]
MDSASIQIMPTKSQVISENNVMVDKTTTSHNFQENGISSNENLHQPEFAEFVNTNNMPNNTNTTALFLENEAYNVSTESLRSNNNTLRPELYRESSNDNEESNSEYHCPTDPYHQHKPNSSLFFKDGFRSIDFVLAYKTNNQEEEDDEVENKVKRRVFEENLINQGLELETEYKSKEQICFIKIHAPLEVLQRYAEILKLRMPMKEIPGFAGVQRSTKNVYSRLKGVWSFFVRVIFIDERYFPKKSHRFTAVYSRDKEYLFDIQQEGFFTASVRSRIVQFILDRQRFPSRNEDDVAFGIERLVNERVYYSAYPLHDGDINEKGTMREKLYTQWASVRKWYRFQPLDYVKDYFGVKIGLYFAWLGYYTYMLMLASVVGMFCFLYSWFTVDTFVPVKDVCSDHSNIKMCPLCDWCNFWEIKETCFYAKITYLIDNPSTVFFAVFMSFWATLFLELWKRYSAEITHRWDLTGFDVHEEHPRPQYLARLENVKKTRTDCVTNTKEPVVPFWRIKLPATIFSFSVVLLLVTLAFVALLAVVVYRMSVLTLLKVGASPMTTSSAIMLTTASAACVNLGLLFILNYMYTHLAEYLTELELWRTQTQFDDSLTLKIYLLQFVNYYASLFYIAFFKGKFVGHPGSYNKILDYRQEECSSGGCLTELCIQLAIIMVGKQAMNSILELIMPIFWKRVQAVKVGLSRLFKSGQTDSLKGRDERWLRDLKLLDFGPRSLFPEYLEMVLQYGFVTIFVAAFPLAPVFALLNNILEMRLDAKILITHHKRPVSQRVRDIGVWYRILDCIGKLSVITNGFIIAFTSDMIPRLVYQSLVSEDGTLDGYLDFSLSYFAIKDSNTLKNYSPELNITTCRYSDYREPPSSNRKYVLSSMFYIILAGRLAFVVIFENFVALVMIVVRWCIPDMSIELRDQIRREVYITNEIIIEQEASRAKFERYKRQISSKASEHSESNANFLKVAKLISGNLSQSQMDLIIHAEDEHTGIGGERQDIELNNCA